MRSKGESEIRNDGRVRYSVLDGNAFISHNRHVSKGTGPGRKGCSVCSPGLGQIAGVLEIVSDNPVDKGSGDDKKETTSSSSDSFFPFYYGPESEVPAQGEV